MYNITDLSEELMIIEDDNIRGFTQRALEEAPAYFWLVPSSSTGKYHPAQSNGQGGLVRHTRSIVYFSTILCRAYNLEGKARDRVVSACILHDLLKYGMALGRHTTKTHDKDGADFVYGIGKKYMEVCPNFDKGDLVGICSNIAYHMGRWTTEDRAKSFPQQYTTEELIVHLADMCSAGREVNLEFLQENLIG